MKRYSILLSLVLCILLVSLAFSESPPEDWLDLRLSLHLGDGEDEVTVPGEIVPWSEEPSFWFTLPEDLPEDGWVFHVGHEAHPEWNYGAENAGEGSYTIVTQIDPDLATRLFVYDEDRNPVATTVYLYVSRLPMPEAPAVPAGAASLVREVRVTEVPVTKAEVTVLYRLRDGDDVAEETVSLPYPSTQAVDAVALLPEGYLPVGDTVQDVTLSEDGTPDVSPIVFYVEKADASKVLVLFVDAVTGEQIISPTMSDISVSDGLFLLTPPENYVPEGYHQVGDAYQLIEMTGGVPSPSLVTFTYEFVATPTPDPNMTPTPEPTPEATETPVPTETPLPYTPTPSPLPTVSPTPYLYGETVINRWAITNAPRVNIRPIPGRTQPRNGEVPETATYVWVISEVVNDRDMLWYHILYRNKEGYIQGDFLDVLSQYESDDFQSALYSPVPESTPGS
ncbi:MAG: hypothetical protein IJ083_11300 [Clostridia bacterium]|nr:hypothetical protein [Clostridia bacterium]